jgi:hypothetical protein
MAGRPVVAENPGVECAGINDSFGGSGIPSRRKLLEVQPGPEGQ